MKKEKLKNMASQKNTDRIKLSGKIAAVPDKSKQAVLKALDANGDGSIGIEDVIINGLKISWVKVDRNKFLRKEFLKNYPEETIDDAVNFTPAHAHIPAKDIDKIGDEVIQYERLCVSGISTVLGVPGGFAIAGTIPADIMQYYGYLLRTVQKLMYLYGFPQIDVQEKDGGFDEETINLLILCMGIMYGVAGANHAIMVMAKGLANGVERKLLSTALTKGTIYPVVKATASWFGVRMTKQIFAGFFKTSIPVAGGVISGGLTYLSFKPCCDKLKVLLQNTMLAGGDDSDTIIKNGFDKI